MENKKCYRTVTIETDWSWFEEDGTVWGKDLFKNRYPTVSATFAMSESDQKLWIESLRGQKIQRKEWHPDKFITVHPKAETPTLSNGVHFWYDTPSGKTGVETVGAGWKDWQTYWSETEMVKKVKGPKRCTCRSLDLFQVGCKCGAIQEERKTLTIGG